MVLYKRSVRYSEYKGKNNSKSVKSTKALKVNKSFDKK